MRIPARTAAAGAERNFDKGNSSFDQASGHQAPLTEDCAAIFFTKFFRLFRQVERFGILAVHQLNRTFVNRVVSLRGAGSCLQKVVLQSLPDPKPLIHASLIDASSSIERLNFEVRETLSTIGHRSGNVRSADNQRSKSRPEKTGSEGVLIECSKRSHADIARQCQLSVTELIGE